MTHTPEQIRAAVERYEARKYDCPASSAEELGRFAATALPELLGEVEGLLVDRRALKRRVKSLTSYIDTMENPD